MRATRSTLLACQLCRSSFHHLIPLSLSLLDNSHRLSFSPFVTNARLDPRCSNSIRHSKHSQRYCLPDCNRPLPLAHTFIRQIGIEACNRPTGFISISARKTPSQLLISLCISFSMAWHSHDLQPNSPTSSSNPNVVEIPTAPAFHRFKPSCTVANLKAPRWLPSVPPFIRSTKYKPPSALPLPQAGQQLATAHGSTQRSCILLDYSRFHLSRTPPHSVSRHSCLALFCESRWRLT